MIILTLLSLLACSPRLHQPGPLSALGAPAPTPFVAAVSPKAPVKQTEPVPKSKAVSTHGRADPTGTAIAKAASHWLKYTPKSFRDDCSGFVCASYQRAGVPLQGNTRSLWDDAKAAGAVHRRKRPNVGDLVFFDNTYDRNKNRRLDDTLTHIGIVLSVSKEDTIVIAHGGTSKGRTTMKMNLRQPHRYKSDSGEVLNDYLRSRNAGGPEDKRLSAELWRAFATYRP